MHEQQAPKPPNVVRAHRRHDAIDPTQRARKSPGERPPNEEGRPTEDVRVEEPRESARHSSVDPRGCTARCAVVQRVHATRVKRVAHGTDGASSIGKCSGVGIIGASSSLPMSLFFLSFFIRTAMAAFKGWQSRSGKGVLETTFPAPPAGDAWSRSSYEPHPERATTIGDTVPRTRQVPQPATIMRRRSSSH